MAYLKAEPSIVETINAWFQEGRALFISSITVAEVLALPELGAEETSKVLRFLKNFISVPFDDGLAQQAAGLGRTYRLKLPDAAIAATAIRHGGELVTRDQVFRKVREITMVKL